MTGSARRQPPIDTTLGRTEIRLSGSELQSNVIAMAEFWHALRRISDLDQAALTVEGFGTPDVEPTYAEQRNQKVTDLCAYIGTLVIPVGGDQ